VCAAGLETGDAAHGLEAQLRTSLVAAVLRLRRMAVADGLRSLTCMMSDHWLTRRAVLG